MDFHPFVISLNKENLTATKRRQSVRLSVNVNA